MIGGSLDKLVYMVNQIATAFRNQPHDKAVESTYDHLWHFWDPRMRSMIVDHLKAGGANLNPIARAAVERLSHGLRAEPQTPNKATDFTRHGETEVADDAG